MPLKGLSKQEVKVFLSDPLSLSSGPQSPLALRRFLDLFMKRDWEGTPLPPTPPFSL